MTLIHLLKTPRSIKTLVTKALLWVLLLPSAAFAQQQGLEIDIVGGNAARWINHACQPNCEADEVEGRIFIKALRSIKPGEELTYDYGITLAERHTPRLKQIWACRCGAKDCTGTMLRKSVPK